MARILVPLAAGCEELEAVTIIDLLRRAEVEVITAGLEAGPVHCSRGTVLIPDRLLSELSCETFDMIVLPGGLPGADYLNRSETLRALLLAMHKKKKSLAAICAAPKVLASLGLLDNRRATAYPGVLDNEAFPAITLSTAAVEVDNQIITSRGPGTAMDFALTLIEQLCGLKKRQQVSAQLQR